MGYRFSVEKFKENFNAKDITDKSIDSVRITHRPDGNFQVFPYKATGKAQAPIVTELETVVSGFFREVLKKKTEPIEYNTLCAKLLEELEIEEEDTDYFKDIFFYWGVGHVRLNVPGSYFAMSCQAENNIILDIFSECANKKFRFFILKGIYTDPSSVVNNMDFICVRILHFVSLGNRLIKTNERFGYYFK